MLATGIPLLYTLICFIITGLCNYFQFLGNASLLQVQNIMEMEEYLGWWPIQVLTFYCALSPLTVVISVSLTLKFQILELLGKSFSQKANIITSLILTHSFLAIALLLNKVSLAIRLSSGTIYPIVRKLIPDKFCSSSSFLLKSLTKGWKLLNQIQ